MAITVEGKHALITGAGSGINLAFAELLLSKGCSVIIGDLRLRPEAESLVAKYPHPSPSNGPSAIFHETDVASWPALTSLWETALSTFGTVEFVIAGAGIGEPEWSSFWHPPRSETNQSVSRDVADADPGRYALMEINLISPIRLMQMAISYWTQNKQQGSIICVGSQAGYTTGIMMPLYTASKHGLHGFVRCMGGLRDTLGIRVSVIAPGAVKTPLWTEDTTKTAMIPSITKWIPEEEVAASMLELLVNEEYGNGTVLEISSGGTRVVPEFNNEPPKWLASRSTTWTEPRGPLHDRMEDGNFRV